MTQNCDVAEALVHDHNPRHVRSLPVPDEVSGHQPWSPVISPESLQPTLTRVDRASRGALADHFQAVAGNRALQRLVEEPGARQGSESDLATRIERAAGGGWSMDRKARRTLERGLGTKLDHVRVHDDAEADAMARSVGATAFTTGSDIFFRHGAYQPRSRAGFRLLAHEATHVLQQAAGGVDGADVAGVSLSYPSDRHEQAAEASAGRMMEGKKKQRDTAAGQVSGGSSAVVQRVADTRMMDLVGTAAGAGGAAYPAVDPWGLSAAAMGGFGNLIDKTAGVVQAGSIEAKQLQSSKSGLGTVGGAFSIASGLQGMSDAKDTAGFIAPAISTGSGILSVGAGIAGMGGSTTGLAALGPLGAAIGLGGTLGALGGLGLWELEQLAHSGTKSVDASLYEGGHTDESGVYTPPVDWAMEKQNKIDAAWTSGGFGGFAEAAYHGIGLAGAGVLEGAMGVGSLLGEVWNSSVTGKSAGEDSIAPLIPETLEAPPWSQPWGG